MYNQIMKLGKALVATVTLLLACNLTGFAAEVNRYQDFSYLVMTSQEFEQWFNTSAAPATGQDASMHPVSFESAALHAGVQKLSYVFGPGDVVSVMVQGKPELSRNEVRVNIDGWVSLPLVGEVQFIDRDKEDVLAEITDLYKEYLIDPQVSIVLNKPRTQYTYVLGAVSSPGPYRHIEKIKESTDQSSHEVYFNFDYHLTNALENAGGLTEDADLRNIHVFNEKLGYDKRIDLFSLLVTGKVDQDVTMRPGDVIYVPKVDTSLPLDENTTRLIASSKLGMKGFPVKVYGYVRKPDLYQLEAQEMTLQSALAKAGGPMPEIASDKVVVARVMPNGKLNKIVVDSGDDDFLLKSNDIVMVTKTSMIHKIDALVETLANVMFRSTFAWKNVDSIFADPTF